MSLNPTKLKGDKAIWAITIILYVLSVLIVYSSTQSLAYREQGGNTFYYLIRQIFYVGIGALTVYLIHLIDYTYFKKFAIAGLLLTVVLLFITKSGMGVTYNEGSRWIKVPYVGLTIQTSDLAKVTLYIFIAKYLANNQKHIKEFRRGYLPLLLVVGFFVLLIIWDNLSTALLIALTSSMMMYFGGVRLKYLLVTALLGAVTFLGVYKMSIEMDEGRGHTWANRIENFISPDENDIESNYQSVLAQIAIANGGLIGTGLGNGTIKNFLPHSYSDYVYANILEETGLVGGLVVMLLYILFLSRCLSIFRKIPYAFGAFLVLAFGFTITFQALINMGVNVGLLPVTGLTLPLLSMGGSSVVFTSIAIGMVLSVSRVLPEYRKPKRAKNAA